jgi:urea transport system permease protein
MKERLALRFILCAAATPLVALAAALFSPIAPALAAPADVSSAVRGLGVTDTEKVKQALIDLAARGDAAALPALEAFYDDRLRVGPDGAVYIDDGKRGLLDALTGTPVTSKPQPLREVELDNELRRLVSPVLAQLRLSARDPAVRLAAAEELAQAGDELLPLMQAALARETNGKVKEALSLALARHDLQSPDAGKRIAALETLRQLAKPVVKGEIESLLKRAPDGAYLERDERVRKAASAALGSIRNHELLVASVGHVLYGLSLASVFLFAALGLAITFGVMGVINMAHGEMLTIGAYATYTVQVICQRHFPGLLPYYLFFAIPVAFAVATAAGILLERTVIRHLYGRPLETLLATWGISLVLIQTIRLGYGASNVAVANPSWLAGGTEVLSGIVVPYSRMGVILFVIAAAAFVWFLLQRTRLGLQVRAVTQNRGMAACMGVNTGRIDMWTFGIGSGIAGLGGVALSQIGNVGPELGQAYILDSFMVVVLGGVGRIAGTVGAALGLGIVQKFLEPISGAVLGKIAVLVVIILFIQRRPQGMFPVKGRVEA